MENLGLVCPCGHLLRGEAEVEEMVYGRERRKQRRRREAEPGADGSRHSVVTRAATPSRSRAYSISGDPALT